MTSGKLVHQVIKGGRRQALTPPFHTHHPPLLVILHAHDHIKLLSRYHSSRCIDRLLQAVQQWKASTFCCSQRTASWHNPAVQHIGKVGNDRGRHLARHCGRWRQVALALLRLASLLATHGLAAGSDTRPAAVCAVPQVKSLVLWMARSLWSTSMHAQELACKRCVCKHADYILDSCSQQQLKRSLDQTGDGRRGRSQRSSTQAPAAAQLPSTSQHIRILNVW